MLAEAHACGLPAVAVRASGVDEVVSDGETGILTKAETGELADAAIGLLLDAGRRREHGRRRRDALAERALRRAAADRGHGRALRGAAGPAPLMAVPSAGRNLRVGFQTDWDPRSAGPGRRGCSRGDPRVRTLLRVLVSYPEVRYILPDRISLEASADPRLLETMARFLERQALAA